MQSSANLCQEALETCQLIVNAVVALIGGRVELSSMPRQPPS